MKYEKNCKNLKEETMKFLNEYLYEDIDLNHLSFLERCAYKALEPFGEYLDNCNVKFPTDDNICSFMICASKYGITSEEYNECHIALEQFINYCFENKTTILSGRYRNSKFNILHVYDDDGDKLYDFVDRNFPLKY